MRTLSVGVVTYRSGNDVVERLLDSLAAALATAAGSMPLELSLFIVCNDEGPEQLLATAALVERHAISACAAVRCELIQGQGNIGYGAAQNLAMQRSSAEFHLILNPDVALDSQALLESLRFFDRHPETAMVAPQGFDGAGAYAGLAKRAPSALVLLLRALSVRPSSGLFGKRVGRYVYSDRLPSDRPQQIELASGCFMFCRTEALRAAGGFDEAYFLYFEDYDLCKRIADHGQLVEVPAVRINHFGGGTARRGVRPIARFVRSGIRYFNTHGWRFL